MQTELISDSGKREIDRTLFNTFEIPRSALAFGAVLAVGIFGSGCSKPNEPIPTGTGLESPPAQVDSSVPVISTKGKTSVGNLDWNTVNPQNTGFQLDFDADGKNDFAILRGNELFYQKGLGNNAFGPATMAARIDCEVSAYSIGVVAAGESPSITYYNKQGQGFRQRSMGVGANGVPYFGDAEALEFQPLDTAKP